MANGLNGQKYSIRGRLDFEEADLFYTATRKDALLRIGAVSFSVAEIADCIRLD